MKYNFYFNNKYFQIYNALFPDVRSKKEAEFLSKFIPSKNSRVLDLGCAWGRHLKALAEMGYSDLTGVDYAEELLIKARENLKNYKIELVQSDFAGFHFDKPFDIILQTFQAFGHESANYDKKNIKNVSANLKKNGIYFLDLRNPVKLLEGGKFDLPSGIKIESKILKNGNRFQYTYYLKDGQEIIECNIYNLLQLKEMFKEADLEVVGVYGDYYNRPYGENSERLIIIGKKL